MALWERIKQEKAIEQAEIEGLEVLHPTFQIKYGLSNVLHFLCSLVLSVLIPS